MNNKTLLKNLSVLMISIMTITLLTGCGSSNGSASSGSIKILYAINDNNDTFRENLYASIKSEAAAQGATLDLSLCGDNVEDQVAEITQAASKGYSVIICRPTDSSTALQLQAATTLPIVYVNSAPDDSVLKADRYIYAGSDEGDAGKLQAEYVIKKLGNKSSMNLIIVMGQKGHSAAVGRTKAIKNTLKDAGIQYNIVFSDNGPSWSVEDGKKQMDTFYKTGQSVDAIFCNNDNLALGVIESVKAHNENPSAIPILGVDATAEGCASVAAGDMSFTALQNAKGQGESAVRAAVLLAQGKSISSLEGATKDRLHVFVPFEPVDASNVKQYQ